jgi:hypothetical protein
MALAMCEAHGMDTLAGLLSQPGFDYDRARDIGYKFEAIREARAHGRPS